LELEEKKNLELEKEARQNVSVAFTMLESNQLYEAKELFQNVRMKFPFRSQIAGRATYGLALALDALGQANKAQDLYRSLRLHPNKDVKKNAATMLSGFEAMQFFNLTAEDDTDYSNFDKYFTSMGRISRFDLSQLSTYKRTEEDIEAEKKDVSQSIGILFGLFAVPAIFVASLKLRTAMSAAGGIFMMAGTNVQLLPW